MSFSFLDITHPDDIEKDLDLLEKAFRGDIPFYRIEKRYLTKAKQVLWIILTVTVLRDESGNAIYSLGMIEDISDRKITEERVRQHEAELAHVLRLSTMGEMTSALAHQLNQPLAAVVNFTRGCVRRLQSEDWKFDKLLEAMEKACSEAERASKIVRDIGNFVRKSERRIAVVDINEIVDIVLALMEGEFIDSQTKVICEFSHRTPPVPVVSIELEQVILNILKNGVEAMTETEVGRRELRIRTSMVSDHVIKVAIKDTGRGLSPGVAAKVFEPFFSTKPEGMGMGLSISQTIVEAHGGQIWVTQNPEGGATFQFTLPTKEVGLGDGR